MAARILTGGPKPLPEADIAKTGFAAIKEKVGEFLKTVVA
jgi:phosphoenolpyruvate carboxykinase (ATP)